LAKKEEADTFKPSLSESEVQIYTLGLLWGLLTIDALTQKNEGFTAPSSFLKTFIQNPIVKVNDVGTAMILKGIEQFAYQGLPEYAILTILDIRFLWERTNYKAGIQTIANLRAFYQDEIDSILLAEPNNRGLYNDVRVTGSIPDPGDVFAPSVNLWTIASAIDASAAKF